MPDLMNELEIARRGLDHAREHIAELEAALVSVVNALWDAESQLALEQPDSWTDPAAAESLQRFLDALGLTPGSEFIWDIALTHAGVDRVMMERYEHLISEGLMNGIDSVPTSDGRLVVWSVDAAKWVLLSRQARQAFGQIVDEHEAALAEHAIRDEEKVTSLWNER